MSHSSEGLSAAEIAQAETDAARDAACDPVFANEQAHLDETYRTLERIGRAAAAKLEKIAADASADKDAMASELTANTATDDDILEMQAEFAQVNRIIDAYNLSHDLEAERLRNVEILLKQPYFAKIVVEAAKTGAVRELYLGTVGMSDERYERVVVDWRSPVAEVFYNQANGPTSFVANGRTVNVDLKLRRQFDIRRNKLLNYFDTTVAIEDPLLIASLTRQRSSQMQAITATIQREQNVVVRHEDVPVLLVSGIAGSGKTSVLLQRIAYLFYQNRTSLRPENLYLITPNELFERYISGVLPDLGEENPETLTWQAFAARLLPPGRGVGSAAVPLERLRELDAAMEGFAFEPGDFVSLTWRDKRLVGSDQMYAATLKHPREQAGAYQVALVRTWLEKQLAGRLRGLAATDEVQSELYDLPLQEQLRLFDEPLSPLEGDNIDEKTLADFAFLYLQDQCADAFRMLENDDWIDYDRIGRRITGGEGPTGLEWIYLKMLVTNACERNARYVFIDEVQDYTASQLLVLARYFREANFLLLGDPNQAIIEGTATFPQIEALFGRERGETVRCRLNTSYRSTPEITALFATLADRDEAMDISSVQRDETVPQLIECADDKAYVAALRECVRTSRESEGLSALIVPWKQDVKRISALLGNDAPAVLDDSGRLPASGVVMLPLKLAKGLEFDRVILANASERVFPANDLGRHRLYTAASRATRDLAIVSQGPATPLLDAWKAR
ncbi:AAA family ATPase [Eggerthellaceae bacterium zg-887]|uniref:HelD family protein n=1 Tax=Xiamenia xianingshaonis TaxID=2682776 RepID=UPI00140981DD|nr:UvrD-helicase domain-containing protein [Xiamenia xianingshaonis]NHM15243.1 AAA family ATPase [Xiamenia xianingshaonis]